MAYLYKDANGNTYKSQWSFLKSTDPIAFTEYKVQQNEWQKRNNKTRHRKIWMREYKRKNYVSKVKETE